ncbi:MAG: hypothetical protein NVS9B7_19030 [Flavisolibacter sp.]
MRIALGLPFLFFLKLGFLNAQTCTQKGQLPSSAFPVCGSTIFKQTTVPICKTHQITVPGCQAGGSSYADKNPFWYKFTCYSSGSLGFLITPNNLNDDYDWQLYDITGHDPSEVFTNISLIVTGNWAGTYGLTGASSDGVPFIQCSSDPAKNLNAFSTMPNLIAGHNYLLLISHFTDTQSGYSLSFGGGSAVIKDPKIPDLSLIDVSCGGDLLRLKLNKPIKCSSLSSDGSEFQVMPGNPTVSLVRGMGCSTSFDTDSILIQLDRFLAPGSYKLYIKQGSDGNTLLDACDNAIPVGNNIDFKVYPKTPTPMDSLLPPPCAPQQIVLHFRRPILCSSLAADGSDFTISGSYPVAIKTAFGFCSPTVQASKDIAIQLSQPLQRQGSFIITLKQGTDGNTIIDECGTPTPAGASVSFSVKDTVSARFTFYKRYGCLADTVYFNHPGGNAVNLWSWDLDENNFSNQQNPITIYNQFSNKNIQLIVSNGFCADTTRQVVILDNYLKADFSSYYDICPNETTSFINNSQGRVVQYSWSFGDGGQADLPSPQHIFNPPSVSSVLPIQLIITDSLGCKSSIEKQVKLYSSCVVRLPTGFTPNNDGKNDFFRPLNAVKAENADFKIYNRWGQLVFESHDWKQGWDGKLKGQAQPSGVYVWFFHFIERDSKESRFMKGTTMLIR